MAATMAARGTETIMEAAMTMASSRMAVREIREAKAKVIREAKAKVIKEARGAKETRVKVIREARATKARATKARATKARATKARVTKAKETRVKVIREARATKAKATKARATKAKATKAKVIREAREAKEAKEVRVGSMAGIRASDLMAMLMETTRIITPTAQASKDHKEAAAASGEEISVEASAEALEEVSAASGRGVAARARRYPQELQTPTRAGTRRRKGRSSSKPRTGAPSKPRVEGMTPNENESRPKGTTQPFRPRSKTGESAASGKHGGPLVEACVATVGWGVGEERRQSRPVCWIGKTPLAHCFLSLFPLLSSSNL